MIEPCVCMVDPNFWIRATVRPLTEEEKAEAIAAANDRQARGKKGRRDNLDRREERSDVKGALAERAFCVLFDIPWEPHLLFHAKPDVKPDYEIRYAYDGRLKIRLDEPDDPFMVNRRFAVLQPAAYEPNEYLPNGGSFWLWGWCYGREARGWREMIDDPPRYKGHPAYFIPPDRLHRFPVHAPKGVR